MAKVLHSSLIHTYLKKYQEDPTSRVFAPLAEAYRKAGLINEAIEIAREGLRVHPSFAGGRVALARALFDKKLYKEVLDELTPITQEVPDNLVAQRLYAESSLMLGLIPQALSAYKMLLYFNASDSEAAQIVQELEAQSYERGVLKLRTDPEPEPIPEFDIRSASSAIGGSPEVQRSQLINRIEKLQGLLQKVERYRVHT